MRKKPNYEKGVDTWRIDVSGKHAGFVKVKDDGSKAVRSMEIDPFTALVEQVHTKGKADHTRNNEYLVRSALRNKENMKKLLKAIPMPWDFTRLSIACMMVALVSVGTMVAIYIIFGTLFDTIMDEIKMTRFQINTFRAGISAASMCLQLIGVNEYWRNRVTGSGLISLENTYPGTMSSKAELFNWTKESIEDSVTEMKDDLLNLQNAPHHTLTDALFDYTINYIKNGSDLVYNNVSLLIGYELVLTQLTCFAIVHSGAGNDLELQVGVAVQLFRPSTRLGAVQHLARHIQQGYRSIQYVHGERI